MLAADLPKGLRCPFSTDCEGLVGGTWVRISISREHVRSFEIVYVGRAVGGNEVLSQKVTLGVNGRPFSVDTLTVGAIS
jgi:hypothetical protein